MMNKSTTDSNEYETETNLSNASVYSQELGMIIRIPLAPPKERKQEVNTSSHQHVLDDLEQMLSISNVALKQQDPFLYFSNDERRMRYLKDVDDTVNQEDISSQRPVQRKTCISFEVHHSVIMDDLFSGMDELDECNDFVDDFICGFPSMGVDEDFQDPIARQ
mmetsp:Transcript_18442/g.39889  ORF Transcript_18442/g.39889 Transcript_18442/m.39889 type:complete len:163 (+) Transcript_18442:151-639(+)|eukprot:CAMPEP_0172311008 /NCGR_PEP_ID=MMETSP1058-20130122/13628_1 /TAXON_ID=83371 /ORGANISM="Detonula confervacea, Strain CCMP 353" /LENGTH=162 /DNA_ID=CAMNT_0013024057 /DNA_START=55 /DNA_END=543 /DNA_ORIENTATION=-